MDHRDQLCTAVPYPFSKGFWGFRGAFFSKKPLGASLAPLASLRVPPRPYASFAAGAKRAISERAVCKPSRAALVMPPA